MRNKLYILSLFVFVTLLSCDNKVDDVFDTPAEKRVTNLIRKCDQSLLDSKYGWVCDYETGSKDKFRLLFSFKEGQKVTISSDFQIEETTTQYGYNASEGAVLSFGTYGVIHKLADPQYIPVPGEKRGKGFEGDYEFTIQEVYPDSIIFKGLKYQNRVKFVKATAETKEKMREQMSIVGEFFKNMQTITASSIVIKKGNESLAELVSQISDNYFFSTTWASMKFGVVKKVADGYEESSSDIILGKEGFKLEPALDIDGKSIDEFIWDSQKEQYVAKVDNSIFIGGSNLPFFVDKNALNLVKSFSVSTEYSDAFVEDFLAPLKEILPNLREVQLYRNYALGNGVFLNEIDLFVTEPGSWSGLILKDNVFNVSSEREDIFTFDFARRYNGLWGDLVKTDAGRRFFKFFVANNREFLIISRPNGFKLVDVRMPKYWIVFEYKN